MRFGTLVLAVGFLAFAGMLKLAAIPLPEGAVARLGAGWINDVKLSPDGKYLAVATSLGIELRDVQTLELVRFFRGHTEPVGAISFSPDGRILASGSYDQTVKLWDVATGALIRTLASHKDAVVCVSFSQNGKTLASSSVDGTIKLWDVASGALIRTLKTNETLSIVFAPDGKVLASGSYDKTVNLWDVTTGGLIRTFIGHTGPVRSVSFSPDARILASGSDDHTIKLWDAVTGTIIRTLTDHTGEIWSVEFSPDGRILASGSTDNTIKLWDVSLGALLRTIQGHTSWVISVAFSSDGATLVSADNIIKLWDVATGALHGTIKGYTDPIWCVAFSPGGRIVASGSGKTVKLWDIGSGVLIRTLENHTSGIRSIAFSPDGRTLASGLDDNTIKLWDVSSGALIRSFTGHTDVVESVSFSPDGRYLASGSLDGKVKLWEIDTGLLIRTLENHTGGIRSIAFSPDGRTLASGEDDSVKLWNVTTGALIRTHEIYEGGVNSVEFSPDGMVLASSTTNHTIKLWDVATGILLRTFKDPSDPIQCVAFSPDGRIVASGSGKAVKLWDIGTGALIRSLTGHTGDVESVSVSPDGRYLASGSWDGTILLWDIGGLFSSNQPPVSIFTWKVLSPDRTVPQIGDRIEFDATDSYDPDGRIIEYRWDWESDGAVDLITTKPRVVQTFDKPGYYQVSLIAVDDRGLTSRMGQYVNVLEGPPLESGDLAPQFVFSSIDGTTVNGIQYGKVTILYFWASWCGPCYKTITVIDELYKLHSTGGLVNVIGISVDTRKEDVLRFVGFWGIEWPQYFSPSGFGNHIARLYRVGLVPMAYLVGPTGTVVERFDGGAEIREDLPTRVEELISSLRKPPVADFSISLESPSVLDVVKFTDRSSDLDGEVISWLWEFGDGGTSTGQHPTHQYSNKGTHTVTLTVTDNDGLTATVSKAITVVNLLPEASFIFEPEESYASQPVSFDASASQDRDGAIEHYAWDFDGDGKTDAEGPQATWTFLQPGTYSVALTVIDNDGASAVTEQVITVVPLPEGPLQFENLWALVVGVSDYKDASIRDLEFPEADAESFYGFLTSPDGGGFSRDHVFKLLGEEATKSAVQRALGELIRKVEENDLVVFFFAGHGAYDVDYNGDEADGFDEYLVTYDADPNDFFSTSIRDDEVGDWLSSLRSKHVLVVLDACFSGGAIRAVRGITNPNARADLRNQVFSDLVGEGRLFLAAAQENEPSYEDERLGHGVFTYFLLRGVGYRDLPEVEGLPRVERPEADQDEDGRVTVEELERYLEKRVPTYVRDQMHVSPQHPLLSGDEVLTRVALNGYGVPLLGEVTTVDLERHLVVISLGSRQGILPGDRFEVIQELVLPDGTVIPEVRAVIEVTYILGPNRSACRIIRQDFPIEVHDQVRPAEEERG